MKRSILLILFLLLMLPNIVLAERIPICKYEMDISGKYNKRMVAIYYYPNGSDKGKFAVAYSEEGGKTGSKGPGTYRSVFSTDGSPNVYYRSSTKNNFYCPSYGILDIDARNEICLSDYASQCADLLDNEVTGTSKTYDIMDEVIRTYRSKISSVSGSSIFTGTEDSLQNFFYDAYESTAKQYFGSDIPNDFKNLFNNKVKEKDILNIVRNSLLSSIGAKCHSDRSMGNITEDVYDECVKLNIEEIFSKATKNGQAIVGQDCTSLLGDPDTASTPAYYLRIAFSVIRYVAIIILVVATVIDFITATAQSNEDALQKAMKKALIRFVLCIVIFVLPTLITFILRYLNDRAIDMCGIGG